MSRTLHTGTRSATASADIAFRDLHGRLIVADAAVRDAAREAALAELAAVDRLTHPRGLARLVRAVFGEPCTMPAARPALWPHPYGVTAAGGPAHHVATGCERLDGRGRLRLPGVPCGSAHAAQRCAEAAAAVTRCGVLVGLGSATATSGLAPAGGWRVQAGGDVLAIDGGAVCVVGRPGGGRLRRVDGRRGTWRQVAVLAPTAPAARRAATEAVRRGAAAPGWLAAQGLPALLVHADGRAVRTLGWPRR